MGPAPMKFLLCISLIAIALLPQMSRAAFSYENVFVSSSASITGLKVDAKENRSESRLSSESKTGFAIRAQALYWINHKITLVGGLSFEQMTLNVRNKLEKADSEFENRS